MSTDELVKGIRRIVEQDEKPKGLGDADALKPIGISRGIAYIGSGGSVRGSGAEGGGNDTSPPAVPEPETTPDEGVPDDGGGTGTDSDSGGKTELTGDAADVDDAITQNSKVTSVTGTDPATATLTSVNFDSRAGIEYVPPAGWDDPDSGPLPDGFQLGFYWTSDSAFVSSIGKKLSPEDVHYAYAAELNALPNFRNYEHSGGAGNVVTTSSGVPTRYSAVIDGEQEIGPGNWISDPQTSFTDRNTCSGSDSETYCPTTEDGARPEEHPSDGECSIAYDHSEVGYKGHEKDPDCSASQKTASTCTTIRSQTQPSRYFRYCRLNDGGTKITEVDSGGTPVPGTITKIMDGAGNITAFVDVSLDNFYQ